MDARLEAVENDVGVIRSGMATKTELQELESKMATEFQAVRSEMHDGQATLKSELMSELQTVRQELRSEMATGLQAVRSEMEDGHTALMDGLRSIKEAVS